jgi:hypothetical protein
MAAWPGPHVQGDPVGIRRRRAACVRGAHRDAPVTPVKEGEPRAMRNAKVLIPENARPDVVSPLIDAQPSPDTVQGSDCKEGKEGDKSKEVAKDHKLVSTEIDPEITKAREHFAL